MGIRVSVEKQGDVWIIGDGGRIAGGFGVRAQPNPPVLGLVVHHPGHIGGAVEQMEKILQAFHAHQNALLNAKAEQAASTATNGAKPKVKKPRAATVTPAGDKLTIDDLGLDARQLWRLKAAKVSTIAKLGSLTEDQLAAKKGIGPAIVKSVKKGLKKHGLRLSAVVG